MLKIAAGGLWACSFTLIVLGTVTPDGGQTLEILAWGVFAALLAQVVTVALVIRAEVLASRQCLAEAVGRAVGRQLSQDDRADLHSVR